MSDEALAYMAAPFRYHGEREHPTFIALVIWLLICSNQTAFPQNNSTTHSAITIEGTVRNSAREPIAGVSVLLEEQGQSVPIATTTNPDGTFILPAPHAGTYTLRARKSGWRDAVRENLVVSATTKDINLVLAGPAHDDLGKMEFEDTPNFTVAGVTDWTHAGGHGSDAGLRTSEALARETVALKPNGSSELSDQFLSDDMAGRKTSGSESELRAALVRNPGSFAVNQQLGEYYFLSKKYQEAIPLLEAAYRIDPANYANGYDLALTYRAVGDLARAREQVRKMLVRADKADLHRLLGDLNERLGDPLEAVREYEIATRLDPSEQNYFDWGTELLLHRAVLPAVEVFTKGSSAHPESVRILSGLGAALYAGGFYDKAAERLCAASDLKPTDPAPYLFLGKMEEAAPIPPACGEEKLARFVQTQPGNALAHYYYAVALLKRGKVGNSAGRASAETLLEKAVSIDPQLAEAHLQLGILCAARGAYEQAIPAYRKAIEANPQLGEAHYRLGLAYKRTGEEAKAQQEFQAHEQVQKTEAAAIERQRREVRQFLIVLKDHPATTSEK